MIIVVVVVVVVGGVGKGKNPVVVLHFKRTGRGKGVLEGGASSEKSLHIVREMMSRSSEGT